MKKKTAVDNPPLQGKDKTVLALSDYELCFRQLIENIHDVFWIIDINAKKIFYISPSYEKIWGYSVESLQQNSQNLLATLLPEDRPCLQQKFKELSSLPEGATNSFEFRIKRADGEIRWIHTDAVRVKREATFPEQIVGLSYDITEQKDAELRQIIQYQVTSLLNESSHIKIAMHSVLKIICENLNMQLGTFWLTSQIKQELIYQMSWHIPDLDINEFETKCKNTHFTCGRGIPGTAWQTKKVYWTPDIAKDALALRKKEAKKIGIHSGIAFPILFDQEVLGIMEFFCFRKKARDEKLLDMLAILGNSIGAFIKRTNSEKKLRESQSNLAAAQQLACIGSWELNLNNLDDINANPLHWSDEVFRIFGYQPGEIEVTNEAFFRVVHPEDRDAIQQAVKKALKEHIPYDITHRILLPNNIERIIHEKAEIIYHPKTNLPIKMLGTLQDITEKEKAKKELAYLAYHDALTRLPNRTYLEENINAILNNAKKNNEYVAVLFLDLDEFKTINNALGHDTGDKLLQAVANRLLEKIRGNDLVIRIGGDEFIIILTGIKKPENIVTGAQKILSIFQRGFFVDGEQLYTTTSIGISVFPQDGTDHQTLLKHSDIAMYSAKEAGRNNFQFCRPELTLRLEKRMQLDKQLRHALAHNQLTVHYQTKINLHSNTIVGVEALIRWVQQPENSSPTQFIALAEETGFIVPLTEFVMKEIAYHHRQWQNLGLHVPIAVNFSARLFNNENIVAKVRKILHSENMDPHDLDIEITESFIMQDAERNIAILKLFNDLGIKIAIDDFGSGYSSLNYLQRFNVNSIKIDKSFLQDIPANQSNAVLVNTIIAMGHSLGVSVVAEGIETEEQLAFVKQKGCDEAQGYYFCKPLSFAEMTLLLKKEMPRK